MFTGIVEELGSVDSLDGPRLRIRASTVLDDVTMGASTAVNGVCTISDQDCKAWNGCKMLGRCSFVNGDCAAKDDGDCARSAACQHAGLCRAANGSCTKN